MYSNAAANVQMPPSLSFKTVEHLWNNQILHFLTIQTHTDVIIHLEVLAIQHSVLFYFISLNKITS